MIVVKIDGTEFHCSTPEEAFKLHQLRQEAMNPVTAESQTELVRRPVSARSQRSNGAATVDGFIDALEKHNGEILDSKMLKDLIGASSEHGVGPKLRKLGRLLQEHNPPIDIGELLVRQEQNDGTIRWRVNSESIIRF